MSYAVLVLLLAACANAATEQVATTSWVSAPDGSNFRFDYYFHEAAGGWLKLHRTTESWHTARLICRLEGSKLASPLNEGLFSTMKSLMKKSSLSSIFTGTHAFSIGSDYFSIEGIHILEMPIKWEENFNTTNQTLRCLSMDEDGRVSRSSCYTEEPFFCYKKKDGPIKMNPCSTTDEGYRRNSLTGSCYKFHQRWATWSQAHTTCTAEGSHLAIINSEEEAEVISRLTRGHSEFVFVGLFSWYRDDKFYINQWQTVDDKTPSEAGFDRWLPGEPNNNGEEYCGSIGWDWGNVGYNDLSCDEPAPFICERPAEKPTTGVIITALTMTLINGFCIHQCHINRCAENSWIRNVCMAGESAKI